MTSPLCPLLGLPTAALVAIVAMAACGSSSSSGASTASGSASGSGPVPVTAGDKNCDVASTALTAGRHQFEVTNTGSQVTEVYVYAAGDRIVGEVENVGPATKRTLTVDLPAGSYQVACKPGMVENGARTTLSVTAAS